jgi:hypothetical protein
VRAATIAMVTKRAMTTNLGSGTKQQNQANK